LKKLILLCLIFFIFILVFTFLPIRNIIASDPLLVTTASLPDGEVGKSYSQSLSATGGTLPYTWSIIQGNLPSGLTLDSKGLISGIPTTTEISSFTVKVVDSGSPQQSATKDLTIVINRAGVLVLTITTASLPDGEVGKSYSQSLSATGGTLPYTWSIIQGNLPSGLTLDSKGLISGIPTTTEISSFTVKVVDSGSPQQYDKKGLSITIVVTPVNNNNINNNNINNNNINPVSETSDLSLTDEEKVFYEKTKIGFLIMLYNRILDRDPEKTGLDYWLTLIESYAITGGELVNAFVLGDECLYKISVYTDSEFITFLYKTLFYREPDTYGFDSWLFRMRNGMDREKVLDGFIHSKEFESLCNEFSIKPYINYIDTKN
jgi:hypothetical protein